MRCIVTLIAPLVLIACATPAPDIVTPAPSPPEAASEVPAKVTPEADPEALRYVKDRLVGNYTGQWNLFGLDANDKVVPGQTFTDTITARNPRIEENRAIVDIVASMDMGGDKPFEMAFIEGVEVGENGARGAYFVEIHGHALSYEEVKPGVWQNDSPLTPQDYAAMANVTAENVVSGTKRTTKVVTVADGLERHEITSVIRLEYKGADGTPITVEYTAMTGHHQQTE